MEAATQPKLAKVTPIRLPDPTGCATTYCPRCRLVFGVDLEDVILKPEEAAEYLRIKTATVYDLAKKRIIPSFNIGRSVRFRLSDLVKWIESGGCDYRGRSL